jgi:hypothetical protein
MRPERNALPVPQNFPTLAAGHLRGAVSSGNQNLATFLKANYT